MAEQLQARELRGWTGSGDAVVPDDREDRLLSWRSVRDITGLSRTTAWRMQQTGDFPKPVPISPHRVGWWESELTAWKARRRSASQTRPRPYGGPKVVREAPHIPPGRLTAPAPSAPEPPAAIDRTVVQKTASRRARPRAVSPDQIDFGF